jgi:hypothetical protein
MPQDTGRRPQSIRNEPQNVEETVRTRAYELYEKRGREDGHEVDDWLHAEEEVTKQKIRTTAA